MTHLDALQLNLSNERNRLAAATCPKERELRAVWVAQLEKEIAGEKAFLGMTDTPPAPMSDDDLFAELNA